MLSAGDPTAKSRRIRCLSISAAGSAYARDVDVEAPVLIDVADGCAGRPCCAVTREAHVLGDVRERAISVVAPETIVAEVGNEDVDVPIAIEIGSGRTKGPVDVPDARVGGHVGERAIAVVAPQRVGEVVFAFLLLPKDRAKALVLRRRIQLAHEVVVAEDVAVGDEHIHPAVLIEVEPRGPGSDGLDQELLLAQPTAVVHHGRCPSMR